MLHQVTVLCAAVVFSVLAGASQAQTVLRVHVQGGSDRQDGSAGKPFDSIWKAREAIRGMKQGKAFPEKGVVVELEGAFAMPVNAFALDASDGGLSADAPVVYRAAKRGALFIGGHILPESGFRPVTDAAVLARLPEEARGRVVAFDLKPVGVAALAPLPDKFSGWNEMEVFSGGRAMRLARWPNAGWAEIAKVIDRGVKPVDKATGEWEFGYKGGTFEYAEDAPARWDVGKGIWMNGFWCHDWANETLKIGAIDKEKRQITSAAVHTYGIGNSSKWHTAKRRYYVFNLLEELDTPGEWYVDRENRLLYFYPVNGDVSDVVLSVQKKPIFQINGARHIRLEGLTFQYSTGKAVALNGCENVVLENLRVSDITTDGIGVYQGKKCGLNRCEVSGVGGTCVSVTGGDRKSLTACNHFVTNCRLHHSGRLQRTQGKCLTFGGVGIRVAHNLIYDAPYIAVTYGGNENLFEYNEVHSAMMESGDGGGLYTGRDWGSQGNIVRYNYFHHFGKPGVDWQRARGLNPEYEPLRENVSVMGVYLDDCDSGDTVSGNIFYRVGWSAFVGGGRDNTVSNNLFIECTSALHLDDRGLKRARPGEGIRDGWDLLAKLQAFNFQEAPWKDKYPHLVNIMGDAPKLPLHNVFCENVAINCSVFLNTGGSVRTTSLPRLDFHNNLAVGPVNKRDAEAFPQTVDGTKRVELCSAALPGSADPDVDGFKVQDSADFKKRAPWFKRIPFEQIGLTP
ncbi:MAG: right-handed parallel beta-helix repeat-containing protein [Kiritimatiellae bacterium]|nr:right-handed parallel beta-helix repeat-containing protein [Kiritimatiellia bacterium]